MDTQKYTNYPLTISQILGLIEANDIAVPEIQRPFVWRKSQVSDQNQMIVYLKHLKVQEGGFVCPLNRKEQLALPQARLKSGHEHIAIYGIQIPDTADDFVSFSEMMRVQEKA